MNIIQRIARYRDKRLRMFCAKQTKDSRAAEQLYRFVAKKYPEESVVQAIRESPTTSYCPMSDELRKRLDDIIVSPIPHQHYSFSANNNQVKSDKRDRILYNCLSVLLSCMIGLLILAAAICIKESLNF